MSIGHEDWLTVTAGPNVDAFGWLRVPRSWSDGASVKSRVPATGVSFKVASFKARCQIGLAIGLERSCAASMYAQRYYNLATDTEGVIFAGIGLFAGEGDRRSAAKLGDVLTIEYDGSAVLFLQNGAEIHKQRFVIADDQCFDAHATVFGPEGAMEALNYLKDDFATPPGGGQ